MQLVDNLSLSLYILELHQNIVDLYVVVVTFGILTYTISIFIFFQSCIFLWIRLTSELFFYEFCILQLRHINSMFFIILVHMIEAHYTWVCSKLFTCNKWHLVENIVLL